METAIDLAKIHPDQIAKNLVATVGCTGTCTYTIVGSTAVPSGQCTGTDSCPQCPTFSPSTVRLVAMLPTIIPNPDDFSIKCGTISADVPILKLYDDYVVLYELAVAFEKKFTLYRTLSILLGVVSLLSIGGLIYTIVSR